MFGGAPYFIQKALMLAYDRNQPLEDVISSAPAANGEFRQELWDLHEELETIPDFREKVLPDFNKILKSDDYVLISTESSRRLAVLGLIEVKGRRHARISSLLYRLFFQDCQF